MKAILLIESAIGRILVKMRLNMREKLIILFLIVMVIPITLLAINAWGQFQHLTMELRKRNNELRNEAIDSLTRMGRIAVEDSIDALNNFAVGQMERSSTDLARQIADFLYQRDDDIRFAAELEPSEAAYRQFLRNSMRPLLKQQKWVLANDGKSWVPPRPLNYGLHSPSSNSENDTSYHNRPAELWETENRPLFLEMTYVDLDGNEIIKATVSSLMDPVRKNISSRRNTFVKAETYFSELKRLKPGEIYVSDVIGAYVGSMLIGTYTPESAESRGVPYQPEKEAFAGRENPNGKRFRGIIRWAAPVVRGGTVRGYVTLALDHDHIMEFTDHITPMAERYTEMPSAIDGNYAFMWDYQCRNIANPRHHSIVGYNPETGEPEVPWLEDRIYNEWQASGKSYAEFIKDVPVFFEQSRSKKPAPQLTAAGLVALDGRYLNNAPQCTGWFDLTKEGGSGSFLALWSGIWKPNAAATIPYYTGNYGKTKRGFGFVTIGAGLEDFQRPSRETENSLEEIIVRTNQALLSSVDDTNRMISSNLRITMVQLGAVTGAMILIAVLIAIWMASVFSKSITNLIDGISRFRSGDRHFRFNAAVKDEIGTLADSFDEMADSLAEADRGPLVIVNNEQKVLYINDICMAIAGKTIEQILDKPYNDISLYPPNSIYDPIAALNEKRDTDIIFNENLGCYFKGEASYLTDKQGNRIGYIITSTDVTEIMEQQQKLEQAVIEAKLANEHKGNFLARMSHEIRTPMNAIIGMTGIVKKKLQAESYSLEDVLANIIQIETSSHHLLGLLNDILDVSKIEAGKIELSIEDMDLLKLAQTVTSIIQPRCSEKNISFVTRFELPNGVSYQGDALRLRQVLINLLGNAVKFTPECGKVFFDLIRKGLENGQAEVFFSVRDTGIGISPEAIGSLFKPFQQADNQITQKYGGTGLGLAISKNIVQMFGGDIAVHSTPGEGSEFCFSLLLPEAAAEQTEEIHIDDVTGRLEGKRALLVDDVDINRVIASSLLESTGLAIDEAEDGSLAVKTFSESALNTYDIIYMDVQMPVMNGYEAAQAIRAFDRPDAKTVPIVALTANAFREDIDKALASGMNAHLAKPMDAEKTLEVTFKLLGI